ncbi:MAG TPA: hypothetical protein P5333_08165 [Caldilinea sp.]|nr:hypothetical protein [Caldilinea sp.]
MGSQQLRDAFDRLVDACNFAQRTLGLGNLGFGGLDGCYGALHLRSEDRPLRGLGCGNRTSPARVVEGKQLAA